MNLDALWKSNPPGTDKKLVFPLRKSNGNWEHISRFILQIDLSDEGANNTNLIDIHRIQNGEGGIFWDSSRKNHLLKTAKKVTKECLQKEHSHLCFEKICFLLTQFYLTSSVVSFVWLPHEIYGVQLAEYEHLSSCHNEPRGISLITWHVNDNRWALISFMCSQHFAHKRHKEVQERG